jgi:hypothetical protein
MDANEQAELNHYRQQAADSLVTQALTTGLAGRVPSQAAALQVAELLRKDVRLVDLDGRKVAVGPGGQPVGEYIAARLASPEFAHFLGTKDSGSANRPAAPGATGDAPRTLNEAVRKHLTEQMAAGGNTNARWPAMPTQPKG